MGSNAVMSHTLELVTLSLQILPQSQRGNELWFGTLERKTGLRTFLNF